ncbi:aminotransferase class V-fold PLP-dependent enzyme [bacterium]|nr:aminotransferase class V-fold PLP-dependent enzyme [bacterium]
MDEIIYLDNAATAWPKPDAVYETLGSFYREFGVNPGRSGFDRAIEAGDKIQAVRKRLTAFFGGDEDAPERLCFSYNATDALNLIIQGLVDEGDHVISTNLEHNSVLRPLNHLTRDKKVQVTFLPFDSNGFIDPDEIARAVRPNTKLVIVNHGSNVIGSVQPLADIGQVCTEKEVIFAVDTSQTAGVIPINMKEMKIDVLAFTGHKALMGCTGIGGLCVRKDVVLNHTRSGGTGVKSAYPYHLDEYPYRLEFGTVNIVGIAALWAGQEWIEQQGIEQIYSHEMKLAHKLVDGFKQIKGVTVYCCDSLENHLSTVTINFDKLDAGNAGIILDVDFNIATRTGLHCAPLVHQQLGILERDGGVRFSIGFFNTEAQIDHAIDAVATIARDYIK